MDYMETLKLAFNLIKIQLQVGLLFLMCPRSINSRFFFIPATCLFHSSPSPPFFFCFNWQGVVGQKGLAMLVLQ